jgi:hypothetical protein
VGGIGLGVFTANHGVGGMGLGVLDANLTPIAPVRTTKARTVATIHLLMYSSETGKLRGGVYEEWSAVKGENSHTCVLRVHVYPCWLSQSLYLVVRGQVRNGKRRGQEYVGTTEIAVIVLRVLLRMMSIRQLKLATREKQTCSF